MVEVESLTKQYGRQVAVRDVSFSVAAGEVVGLLGPNGAGKSTIMRILSCFMPATSGTVRVAGRDVFHEADAVRRRIGYMPENNPLYHDMRVREYLKFRARLKGLGRARSRQRVDQVLEQCGLTDVAHKMIAMLSKGYRQRVGLADALVHEPELIILDEPTIGLDPRQIRTVRETIKELGRERTILLSSHILPEIEMTCSRVLILYEGCIVAADTAENLRHRVSEGGQVVAEIAAPVEELRSCWADTAIIEQAELTPLDDGYVRCALKPQNGSDLRQHVFETAVARGWKLRELTHRQLTLEDIYLQVTRKTHETEEF